MEIIDTAAAMTAISRQAHREGKRVGFVPTMGALHRGHISLVRAAHEQTDIVVASIFVNPTQFGPAKDFSKYPRTFAKDSVMLAAEKTNYIFSPSVEEMYPKGATTWVDVEGLSGKLDGRSRPGHFRGVTTVVSKLFNIVQPDLAFFGQKDAAQVAVIRKMVRDLNFPVRIVVCPIIREIDALAMSSRNAYLNPEQRNQALVLSQALQKVEKLAAEGETSAETLIAAGRQAMAQEPSVRLDYFEVVNPDTLEPVPNVGQGALVAVAAYVGTTRLIDNLLIPAR